MRQGRTRQTSGRHAERACYFACHYSMTDEKYLLADAEAAEDSVEHIVVIDCADYFA